MTPTPTYCLSLFLMKVYKRWIGAGVIFFAVLFVFTACSDKKKYDKAIFIFEKHSIKKIDSSRIRTLLKQKGFAGLKTIDKYARVINPKEKIKFYGNDAAIKSIGVLFDGTLNDMYVRRVFNDSPAFRGNIRDLDKVLSGNYNDMRDNAGDIIKLKLQRRSVKKPFFVSVKKERFLFPRIFGFPLTRNAGYMRVGSFFKGSSKIIEQGLSVLTKMGARSIILDLRYNNGGNIQELCKSINLFFPAKKLMFSVKSVRPGYTNDFYSSLKGKFSNVRLIILVNKDTSMSGEIFAQTLKENNGAFIMGSKTAGKASIQKTFKLLGKEGLSITIAQLFPPSGIDMEEKGADIDAKIEINAQEEKSLKNMWFTGSSMVLLKDPYYKEAVKKVKLR